MKKVMMITRVLSLFMALLPFTGCSMIARTHFAQRTTLDIMSPALPNLVDGIMKLPSGEAAREGLPGMCVLTSGLLEMTPENYDFLCTAALSFTAYGMLKEHEDKAFAVKLYKMAKNYGMRALMLDDAFREAYEEGGINEARKVLGSMDEYYVEALMWTAVPWGLLILRTMSEDAMAAQHLNVVEEMAATAHDLDPAYFYGLPDLELMIIAARKPPMMGGTPEKVEEYYQNVVKISEGGLLMANIFYVEEYLVPYQKHDLAIQKLNDVLNTPHSTYPHLALFNEIAKMKARLLLADRENLFWESDLR